MFITILVILLSKPEDPVIMGVVEHFKSPSECVKAIAVNSRFTDEEKRNLRCIEIRLPKEI